MGALDAIFADLLGRGRPIRQVAPCDIGDIGDKRDLQRLADSFEVGDTAATGGDTPCGADHVSHAVANKSPSKDQLESQQWRALSPGSPLSPRSPLHRPLELSAEAAERCHRPAWSNVEIELFLVRAARFTRIGRADAEHLAERLTLRDRDGDDRRLCLECSQLHPRGRCLAAARGELFGASRSLEPITTVLQRCECFNAVAVHTPQGIRA